MAAVEHAPQILGHGGAREARRVLELGFGDARPLTHQTQDLLALDFTLG
jgi:hypothetical protein